MTKKETILAWQFVGDTLRDGRPIPADGVKLKHKGKLKPRVSGLHASIRLIDALQYAPGSTLCRVECGGKIEHDDDKLVCSERTIIWRVDATNFLRLFARQCALDVLPLWNAPDVVRQYLETGDEGLCAAARAAVWNAARAAAGVAVRHAVWNAAWDAVRAVAWEAAGAAALNATNAAAWNAARATQNDRIEKLALAAYEANN